MIGLPETGQRAALPWIAAAVCFYLLVGGVFLYSLYAAQHDRALLPFLREILGLGAAPNPSIVVLVATGVLVTIAAFWSAFKDLLEIRREESDIGWLIDHKSEFAQLVLAPAGERDTMRESGHKTVDPSRVRIETLVDDRVRRVMSAHASAGSSMVPVEELRVIAQTHTARLGGFARFANSLLLLLAVLGTFAGVKTALPGLIDAVTASSQTGGLSPVSIGEPLRAVADAFGANAFALIGAVAAGLMTHGLTVGRRNLLERLELVSAEYIYGARQLDTADPLRAAIETMRATLERVHETSGSLLGIESELSGLGLKFSSAFDSLDQRLTAIVEQQDERLHERTSHALESLRERVAEMAGVVDANTRTYAGLVDRIGERSTESQVAIQRLDEANRLLARGLEGAANLGAAAQGAGDSVNAAIGRLETTTLQVRQQVESLDLAVRAVAPALARVDELVSATAQEATRLGDRTTQSLAEMNARAADAWVSAGREMQEYILQLANGAGRGAAGGNGSSVESRDASEGTRLLGQIATALQSRPGALSRAQLVLFPATGIVIGGVILYALYAFSHSGVVAWALSLLGIG